VNARAKKRLVLVFVSMAVAVAGTGLVIRDWSDPGPVVEVTSAEPVDRLKREFERAAGELHLRRYNAARDAFVDIVERHPNLPEAHANLGFALAGLDQHQLAKNAFMAAINIRPSLFNAYYGLAVASEGLGELDTARGAMRTYLHLAPADDPYRRKAESALWEWSIQDDTD
jgi:tetratricopeptide (TPR) repeat protein